MEVIQRMDALIVYKWGYRICKVLLTYMMFVTYVYGDLSTMLLKSLFIIVTPTIAWLYYFEQHNDMLVHIGVLNIVSWLVYFISYYTTSRKKDGDDVVKKELINKIKKYNEKGIVSIPKEDIALLYEMTLSDLKKIYEEIRVPEENKNKIKEGE